MPFTILHNDREVVANRPTIEAANEEARLLSQRMLGWFAVCEITSVWKRGNLLESKENLACPTGSAGPPVKDDSTTS